eukprot:1319380-Prorocentrum_lima.AAC.1
MQIHQGVDSTLVDECLIRACQRHIYEKPVTAAMMEEFERQRIRMEIQDWYGRHRRPWEMSASSDYVPSSDSDYPGPYPDMHRDTLMDVEQHEDGEEEGEDLSDTVTWRVS